MKLDEEKVFKDPIHQYIYVQDLLIWDLINTKEFQRLRRIKQLGTSYFTFHGAEHSRFSHSLGVYEITRKIISLFKRNYDENWTDEERFAALVSALLHDIGHGPFSHSIEKVFQINHEEWSKKIILGDTEIHRLLYQIDPKLPVYVTEVINKTYQNSIIIDLISSQLDADRMDYLLRDAYFTGVNYGTYDLERILRVIRPFQGRLMVKESGMHSVEDYLMSRYQMYWQVYFHPVTRSGEIILRQIFARAKDLYRQQYPFPVLFPPVLSLLQENLDIQEYLALDDSFIYTQFHFWSKEKDFILSDLTSRFLHRRLFHYLNFNLKEKEKLETIKQLFLDNGIDPNYYLIIDSPSDLPYDVYRPAKEGRMAPIYLLNHEGETVEISEKSEIIASITGRKKTEHKLFYPYDFVAEKGLESKLAHIITQKDG